MRAANRDFAWLMRRLRSLPSKSGNDNIKRFGLTGKDMLGVTVTDLRKLAKEFGTDHETAAQLWKTGVHEARLLAGMVEEVGKVSDEQADAWLQDFDSWDIVDETCLNVFCKMPNPFRRARKWAEREKEFEKRAGFALIACLAWYSKGGKGGESGGTARTGGAGAAVKAGDQEFVDFLLQIKKASADERNFVKKSVNWALRQIGKRNKKLHAKAIQAAKEIAEMDSPAAKWIASNALKELGSPSVKARLEEKDRILKS